MIVDDFSSVPQLQLVLDKTVVRAALCCQRLVVARLDYLAVVNDDNLVGVPDRAQAVGDDDDGLATVERVEVLHDGPLVVGIERVGSLVEEDIIRVLVHRTGDEDALTLSLTQPHAVASYLRVVLQWQRHHIVVDARYPCGLQQTFLVDVAVVNSDVACDALRENDTVLHDYSALAAPPFLVERVDIRASDIDLSLQDRIIAEYELDEGRLAAA